MRRNYQKARPKIDEKPFKSNEHITSPEVFLIDESGENIGVVSLEDALTRAREADLDLVEVNPKANPPVAKLVNLGQFKYEREKKLHKQKVLQKKVETKVVKITFRMSPHDRDVRMGLAEKFLSKNDKVKVEIFLRGRERQHFDRSRELITEFINNLKAKPGLVIEEDQPLTKAPSGFSIILANKK
ncbi:MAG: translation initiation factor IF-3 [Patescibacteria group bacterium]|jgi:translation initiation factor IF-3